MLYGMICTTTPIQIDTLLLKAVLGSVPRLFRQNCIHDQRGVVKANDESQSERVSATE
jgi:hypothetical protein